jgi:hypothetical protein
LAYPHDAEAGAEWTTADSVGLFQQRPMFDYGTIRELMDPAESTRIFVRGSHDGKGRTRYFLESPTTMTLAQRCQWTQGSEFPTGENYAPMETVAEQLIKHFGGFPADDTDWILDMADQQALDKYKAEIVEGVRNADIDGSPLAMVLKTIAVDRGHDVQEVLRFVRGTDPNIDTLSVLLDGLSNLRKENAEIIKRLDALTAKPE